MAKIPAKQSPLNSALAKIPNLSQQLNKLVDEASATVRQVESFLEKAHVGSVNSKIDLESTSDFTTSLRYERIGAKFRIAVATENHGVPPPEAAFSVRAFSDCPRDLKLQAFQKLPELIEQIVANLESMIDKTKETTKEVMESIGLPPKVDE
jgi:hypothetical protein